jgi:hypothetical protein
MEIIIQIAFLFLIIERIRPEGVDDFHTAERINSASQLIDKSKIDTLRRK